MLHQSDPTTPTVTESKSKSAYTEYFYVSCCSEGKMDSIELIGKYELNKHTYFNAHNGTYKYIYGNYN